MAQSGKQRAGYPPQPWNPYVAGPTSNPPNSSVNRPYIIGNNQYDPGNNQYSSGGNAGNNPYNSGPLQPIQAPDFHEILLKGQPKVLGTVQIIIVFIHIILGTVTILAEQQYELYYITFAGAFVVNFWSLPFFIISGSLSINVETKEDPPLPLLKAFMAMNILSSIESLGSLGFYFTDVSATIGYGTIDLTALVIFSIIINLLEFCITVSLAHFGRLAIELKSGQQVTPEGFGLSVQYSNPMTNLPLPTLQVGSQLPNLQAQMYDEAQDTDYSLSMPSVQLGLRRTPTVSVPQQNYDGASNRGINRYPGNNMQYN